MTEPELIATHEAAHAVIAELVGLPSKSVSVIRFASRPGPSSTGRVHRAARDPSSYCVGARRRGSREASGRFCRAHASPTSITSLPVTCSRAPADRLIRTATSSAGKRRR